MSAYLDTSETSRRRPRRPGRFFLTSRGSWGDINPFLGLGRELKRRGHQVMLIANEFHRAAAERLGFGFEPYASTAAYLEEQEANRRQGTSRVLSERERIERWYQPELRATYAALARHADPRDSVIVARSWTMAGRLAQEKLGIPLATVYVTPLESVRLLVSLPLLPMPPPNRWAYDALCMPLIDWYYDPRYAFINRFRQELGLAPIRHILSDWSQSPQLSLGLWPDWLYPRRDHWPTQLRLSGFVPHEAQADELLPPDVKAMLAAGEPPLVFVAGTFRSGGAEAFFSTSVEICQRLGRRGILLSESRQQVPGALPASIATFPYVSLRQLLPHCAALVHHGGIGTAARALEAGVPQLLVPVFFDQPLNARRLTQLGLADAVPPERYRAKRVVPRLRALLTQADVRASCAVVSQRMAHSWGTGPACDALEELLESHPREPLSCSVEGLTPCSPYSHC